MESMRIGRAPWGVTCKSRRWGKMTVEKPVTLSVRLTESMKVAIDLAAERAGLTTLDFIRQTLSLAVSEGAFELPHGRTKHGRQKGTLKR